jgi:hypothetical protein
MVRITSEPPASMSIDQIKLPTERQKMAFRLRESQGLTDAEIARVMGLKHRESANRLIARFRRRADALRLLCASGPGSGLLDRILR